LPPPPAPAPIFTSVADSITCVNTEARNGTAYAIYLNSNAPGGFIDLYNSGVLTATSTAQNANGIFAATAIGSTGSPVSVENSPISVDNSGDIEARPARSCAELWRQQLGHHRQQRQRDRNRRRHLRERSHHRHCHWR
jgi:hypothetical protein